MKQIYLSFFTLFSLIVHSQIENGMLVHFPFDNYLDDISTNAISPVNNGSVFGEDRNGLSTLGLSLNGNTYASFNDNSIKTLLPITISVWVKLNSVADPNIIFTSDNEYNNYYGYWLSTLTGTGQVGINFAAGLGGQNSANRKSFTTNNGISVGVWHHIIATINSANDMSIYIDCINQNGSYSGDGSTSIFYSSTESRIGSNIGNNSNLNGSFLNGGIDQLVIWNRELTSNEITYLCSKSNDLNVDEINTETSLVDVLYPNPTNGSLNFHFKNNEGIHKIKLFDLTGKLIFEKSISNTTNFELDMTQFTSQLYVVEVFNGSTTEFHRVIKE